MRRFLFTATLRRDPTPLYLQYCLAFSYLHILKVYNHINTATNLYTSWPKCSVSRSWEPNLEIGQCYTGGQSLKFWTLLLVLNEHVPSKRKVLKWRKGCVFFFYFNTDFRRNRNFLTEWCKLAGVRWTCHRIALPDFYNLQQKMRKLLLLFFFLLNFRSLRQVPLLHNTVLIFAMNERDWWPW